MLESMIRKVLRGSRADPTTPCPDDETLAAYVDRSLAGMALQELEGHLAECESCLDQVVLCSEGPGAAELGLRFDVIVRFLEHAAEVIRGVAEIRIGPAPTLLPTRSVGEDRATLKCVRFGRDFDALTVEVEVEATAEGLGEVRVVPSTGGTIDEEVRVTLLRGHRELGSSPALGGGASFEELDFGNYVIRLSKGGHTIGEVSLRLEGD